MPASTTLAPPPPPAALAMAAPGAVALNPAEWHPLQAYALDVVRTLHRTSPICLIARDVPSERLGAKQYGAVHTPPRGALIDGHYYEVAPMFRRRRFLLDIEWLISEHPELEVNTTMRALRDAVEAVHGTGPLRVAILSASRGDKVSFHVLFIDTCFGYLAQNAFVKQLKERVAPLGFPVGVPDFAIYTNNRAMRMLGQTKLGGDRPLVPYGDDASNDAADYLWCHYADSLEELPAFTWKEPAPEPAPAPVVERAVVEDSPERRALIAECVRMLKPGRADYEPTWAEVGWALFNIGDDIGDVDAFKPLFFEFSRQ